MPQSHFSLLIILVFTSVVFSAISVTCKASEYTFNDKTPPSVLNLRIAKPEPPITPWDTVVIETLIIDDESGVDNVTLFYGIGKNPVNLTYTPVLMSLTIGDCYNGTYEGEIPPQENGTLVWYYVFVYDRAGNVYVETFTKNYFVYFPSSYLSISIGIEDIDMNNLSTSLNVIVTGLLPSPLESPKLILHASNGIESLSDFDVFLINMSTTSRFWYQETINWKVHLIGNPNDYPFDRYYLRLNFTIWWGQIDQLEGENAYYTHGRLLNVWQKPVWTSKTINGTYPQIIYDIQFDRSQYSTDPLWFIVVSMCFLIGGSLIIPPQKLEQRISIYLTTFIFIIGFFFQVKDFLPFHIGFTKAELIFLYLAITSSVFLVFSIIASAFLEKFKKWGLLTSVIIDSLAVVIWAWLFSLIKLPIEHLTIILIALLYGIILRILLRPKDKKNNTQKLQGRL
jgi:hypothetical protein